MMLYVYAHVLCTGLCSSLEVVCSSPGFVCLRVVLCLGLVYACAVRVFVCVLYVCVHACTCVRATLCICTTCVGAGGGCFNK